jgi:hypothetical protein
MMWRTRRDLLNSCASLFILLACLTGCFLIVASSWPDKDKRQVGASPRDAPVATVKFTSMEDVEIVPAVSQTGTIGQPTTLRR